MLSPKLFLRNRIVGCNLVLILVVACVIAGCSHVNDGMVRGRKAVNALMDSVERIVDINPANADSMMRRIDSHSIYNKEQKARYALLYTQAQYKNYQPMTSDSLIMEAVRYYSINKNIDYRFLSYYYLGCVYMELGQLSDASIALVQAEQLVDRIDNDYWKGLLHTQLGNIYERSCDYPRAEDYFTKAADYYKRAGKDSHHHYAIFNIAECERGMVHLMEADSIARIAQDWALENGDNNLYCSALIRRFSCYLFLKEKDSSTVLYNDFVSKIENPYNKPFYYQMVALYYSMVGNYKESEEYLNKAWSCDLTIDDSIHCYYINSLLAESMGQTEYSLECFRKYISLQNDDLRLLLREPVLGAQKEHYRIIAENELLKSRHAIMTLVLCAIIFILIIVIVLVTYHYKKKRMKEQLYDSLAVAEELSGKIEQLKNQVRVQFHERHDMSNRLYAMYFDSESQDKVTKQQLTVTINSLIKEYTAPESVRKLDGILNESYEGIMNRLSSDEIGLSEKELQLLRFSFAGLSSKSVSVIIKETPQNIYQIKSRLLKKVKKNSEELWSTLNNIL